MPLPTINGEQNTYEALMRIDGSKVTTESGIPLMLVVNLPGVTSGAGDVRLAKLDGTPIAREIEWHYTATDDVVIHYPFDTISGDNSQFYVYWGNPNLVEPAADSTYGSEAVYDSNYVGVWHMNNDPSSTTMKDSTGNGYHLTSVGTMTSGDLVDSAYGKGIDFDGVNDGLYHDDDAALDGYTAMNLLVRFKTTASTTNRPLVTKWYTGTSAYIIRMADPSTGKIDAGIYTGSAIDVISAATYNDGNEHTAILNYDGSNIYNIIDGTSASAAKTGTISNAEEEFAVGMYKNGATEEGFFTGNISEIRLQSSSRSSNWDTTTHNSLNNPTAVGSSPFYLSVGNREHQRIVPQFM